MPATTRSSRKRERDDSSSPKRSESSTATGRAPSANTSRRIPPTPVAAPWNGSTADGWLWLSTLNATASPSPRSMTPAFSPGPWRTRSPLVGSRRSRRAECLYPQCSDQSSEKTASSKRFGARPSSSSIRAASASVSPRVRWSGSATGVVVKWSSLNVFQDESVVPDAALERVGRIARKAAPVARPAAHRERGGRGVAGVLVPVLAVDRPKVQPRVDLHEQRQARLGERPDGEFLAQAAKERHPPPRSRAHLAGADELENGLRPGGPPP